MEANNMKAMREALKLCGSRMCRLCKELELARSMLNKRALGVFCHPDKCKAFQAAHAALTAPSRICKYNDYKSATHAYLADCDKRGLAPHWANAIRWLLSPATETKGDADESN